MPTSIKYKTDRLRLKIDYLWETRKEKLFADLSARATRRFPKIAYWITIGVGVQNIADDEMVFEVPYMDVLNRQFLRTEDL
jgi:hypothetical protein